MGREDMHCVQNAVLEGWIFNVQKERAGSKILKKGNSFVKFADILVEAVRFAPICCVAFCLDASAAVYLKADATGDGSGSSWSNACTTWADALVKLREVAASEAPTAEDATPEGEDCARPAQSQRSRLERHRSVDWRWLSGGSGLLVAF